MAAKKDKVARHGGGPSKRVGYSAPYPQNKRPSVTEDPETTLFFTSFG